MKKLLVFAIAFTIAIGCRAQMINPNQIRPGSTNQCIVTIGGVSTWTTCPGGGGTPGGPNLAVQFQQSSAFAGVSGLTFNPSTQIFAAPQVNANAGVFDVNTNSSQNYAGATVFKGNELQCNQDHGPGATQYNAFFCLKQDVLTTNPGFMYGFSGNLPHQGGFGTSIIGSDIGGIYTYSSGFFAHMSANDTILGMGEINFLDFQVNTNCTNWFASSEGCQPLRILENETGEILGTITGVTPSTSTAPGVLTFNCIGNCPNLHNGDPMLDASTTQNMEVTDCTNVPITGVNGGAASCTVTGVTLPVSLQATLQTVVDVPPPQGNTFQATMNAVTQTFTVSTTNDLSSNHTVYFAGKSFPETVNVSWGAYNSGAHTQTGTATFYWAHETGTIIYAGGMTGYVVEDAGWTYGGVLRGAWSGGSKYSKFDVVTFGGNQWLSSVNNNLGNTPATGSSFWGLYNNQPLFNGNYSGGTTYTHNDIVLYSSLIYKSRNDGNVGNTPSTSPSQWQVWIPNRYVEDVIASTDSTHLLIMSPFTPGWANIFTAPWSANVFQANYVVGVLDSSHNPSTNTAYIAGPTSWSVGHWFQETNGISAAYTSRIQYTSNNPQAPFQGLQINRIGKMGQNRIDFNNNQFLTFWNEEAISDFYGIGGTGYAPGGIFFNGAFSYGIAMAQPTSTGLFSQGCIICVLDHTGNTSAEYSVFRDEGHSFIDYNLDSNAFITQSNITSSQGTVAGIYLTSVKGVTAGHGEGNGSNAGVTFSGGFGWSGTPAAISYRQLEFTSENTLAAFSARDTGNPQVVTTLVPFMAQCFVINGAAGGGGDLSGDVFLIRTGANAAGLATTCGGGTNADLTVNNLTVGGTCTGCGGGGGSTAWSALTSPTANKNLALNNYETIFNCGIITSDDNCMAITDSASNTGTGYLLSVQPTSGSTSNIFQAISASGTLGLQVQNNGDVLATKDLITPAVIGTGTTSGYVSLAHGTGSLPSLGSGTAGFVGPASGGTPYLFKLPATSAAGIIHVVAPGIGVDGVNESDWTIGAVSLTADVSGVLPVANGGSPPIGNVTIAMPTSSISANTCTSPTATTMTGVTSTMAFTFAFASDPAAVTGWGSSGGLTWNAWPSTNTLNWEVCNQTGSSITPGAISLNVGAR